MALYNGAKTLKEAILKKTESILENTQYVESMYINIRHKTGEIPTINYSITELIAPEDDIKVEDDER